jgi:hypothetical protein
MNNLVVVGAQRPERGLDASRPDAVVRRDGDHLGVASAEAQSFLSRCSAGTVPFGPDACTLPARFVGIFPRPAPVPPRQRVPRACALHSHSMLLAIRGGAGCARWLDHTQRFAMIRPRCLRSWLILHGDHGRSHDSDVMHICGLRHAKRLQRYPPIEDMATGACPLVKART